ncbi:hypothetical protein ACTFIV_010971 [Dictyostelium citrinum]
MFDSREIIYPYISKSFSYLNLLSKKGKCKPFDSEVDGYNRSESCGLVILKALSDAIKDGNNIYCILKSFSSNVDGGGLNDKSNFYSPSKQSQCDNIKLALKNANMKANMKASDINFYIAFIMNLNYQKKVIVGNLVSPLLGLSKLEFEHISISKNSMEKQ